MKNERIALVCADGVSLDEAQSTWMKYEPGLLDHLGDGACIQADVEGLTFFLMSKKWENIPHFASLVGKVDMVCFVQEAGSIDKNTLISNGGTEKKIDRILAVPGSIPPVGWVYCKLHEIDGSVKFYWVDPTRLKMSEPRSQLTTEQIKVVQHLAYVLSDVDGQSPETWVHNFSCNQNPEIEISIFSRIADVIEKERPYRKAKELKKVYAALIRLSSLPDENMLKDLMSSMPSAKGIKNLDRVVNRWESTLVN